MRLILSLKLQADRLEGQKKTQSLHFTFLLTRNSEKTEVREKRRRSRRSYLHTNSSEDQGRGQSNPEKHRREL